MFRIDLPEGRKRVCEFRQRFKKRARNPVHEVVRQVVAAREQHVSADRFNFRVVSVHTDRYGCGMKKPVMRANRFDLISRH